MSHHEHPLYVLNSGKECRQEPIPLPPTKGGFPFKINTYDDVDEPIFNPKIHLQLEEPAYVRTLDDFKKVASCPKVTDNKGSNFAYSSSFRVRTT